MTPRYLFLTLPLMLALAGCGGGSLFGGEDEAPPLEGERISILELQNQLEPDDLGDKAIPVTVPGLWQNEFWPQAGGYPNHSMQNPALNEGELKLAWRADIGAGSRTGLPLTAQPVIADGRVFTLDTEGMVSAFDIQNGSRLWRASVKKIGEKDPVITGGISFSGGVLFVTSGYDELLALNPQNGDIYWRARLNAPSRAAPTILDNRVFVSTLNNSLQAFTPDTGELLWEYTGLSGRTGLLGAAAPAATQDLIVSAFSSGEVTSLRAVNGSVVWSESLANALRLGGLSDLSDITGLPVIDKDLVIATSFGGRMAAFDTLTGRKVWSRDIGSANTPWVAGEFVYMVTTNNEIVALSRSRGTVLWVSQLARSTGGDVLTWEGPVMAGDRIFAFSSDGRAAEINPKDGSLIREWRTGRNVRIAPAIAGGRLYLLSEDGTLSAYH